MKGKENENRTYMYMYMYNNCSKYGYLYCTHTMNAYTQVHVNSLVHDNTNILYMVCGTLESHGVGWYPVGQVWMNFRESQRPMRRDDHE